jgi:NAD(P)-dependent dehydrogenase (short-subunit alcohol dehydrogenase family)
MAERLRLYGLNALVTSAGSGIGEAVARTLVKHGASVLAVDTPDSGVEQQFAAVKGIKGLSANLSEPTRMPALGEAAVAELGGVDILVCDFPPQLDSPLSDGDAALTALLERRAGLVTALCRSVLPQLKKSPAGRIVNIGFLRTVFAVDGAQASVSAAQDLAALTRALAGEIGEFGSTANYVQPGAIMTAVSREVFVKDKALRDMCIAGSAASRLGEPIDVAKVVLFLASNDAGFVSGTGIVVDGGRATR